MKPLTIAALCAGLAAAPFVAKAAELVFLIDPGQPVAMEMPADQKLLPMVPAQFFAEQEAMVERMVALMQSTHAAFPAAGIGAMAPGSAVVVTSFSDGQSSCSRTVVYDQRGGGAPVVQVRQTGHGCSPLQAPRQAIPVEAAQPEPDSAPRTPAPKLLRVDYRHPAAKPVLHHG